MYNNWHIPQHLDTPPRILMLSLSEALVLLAGVVIGALTTFIITSIIISLGVFAAMRRFKDYMEQFSGFQAYLYWFTPYKPHQNLPASYLRYWKG